jgi:hypothetical protein
MTLKGKIKAAPVPETTKLAVSKSRERDETQRDIDTDVERLKRAWESAGKPGADKLTTPAGFKRAEKVAYTVEKDDRSPVKGMIRRAATLHKTGLVYAKDTTNQDGTVTIVFTVAPLMVKHSAGDHAAGQAEVSQ